MNIKRLVKEKISSFLYTCGGLKMPGPSAKRFRILMYHSVERIGNDKDTMGLAVPPEVFQKHMEYLRENRFRVVGLTDIVDIVKSEGTIPDRCVVITFDDGFRSVLTNALPIIKRCGFAATVFVNIYFIERKLSGADYWKSWDTLSWDEVVKLRSEGLSIGSHALTHRRLAGLDKDEVFKEISLSKEILEKKIGERIELFGYPHGSFNNNVKKIVKECGFSCSCTSIEGANDVKSDSFALKRTEITAFDNTVGKFEKRLLGYYDWIGHIKGHD